MRHGRRLSFSSQRGSALVSGLLLSFSLMLVIGAAVDVGRAFIVRRELVSLADDAALSGSQAIDVDALHDGRLVLHPGEAQAAALSTIGSERAVTGHASAGDRRVTVTVRRRIPTVLLRLAGVRTLTVRAEATATPRKP